MVDITFPSTTAPGVVPAESGGRLINAYSEALPGLPKKPYVLRRSAGITQFSDTARSGFRGSFFDAGQYYSAWNGLLMKTSSVGISGSVGTLPGATWVSFARNNRTPTPDYVVCANGVLYKFTAGGIGAALPNPGSPATPNSVCFGEGYFFLSYPDSRVFASAINGGTGGITDPASWNSLDSIQAQASHDPNIGVKFWNGELYIFGAQSIEVWASGGNPNLTGFPLRRTTVVWRGATALSCITGWEDCFGGQLAWVADDNTIRVFSGYTPQIISTPILHRLIEAVGDHTLMTMGCYVVAGRQCIYLRGPHFWWSYDFSTGSWHERQSYNSDTCRYMGGASCIGDQWVSADANSGKLGYFDENQGLEWGDPLIYLVESQPTQQFPARMQVSRANFTLQQGTGLATGTADAVNPQLEISWSDDDGNTWVPPIMRPIGAAAAYRTVIDATMLGMTGYVGRRWRLVCRPAVYCGVLGGTADLFIRK